MDFLGSTRFYKWTVQTACGTGTKTSPVYQITVPAPPITVTTQPVDRCVNRGDSFTFSTAADVPPPKGLSYQWQINTGGGWQDLPGATGLSYAKSAADPATDQGLYRCRVTNTITLGGTPLSYSVYSNQAKLTVLYFSSKPSQYIAVLLGGTVNMYVTPAGGNVANPVPPTGSDPAFYNQYTYKWYHNGVEITGNATAATPHLVVENAQIGTDDGDYYCEISDGCVSAPYAFAPPTTVTVTNNPILIAATGQPVGGGRLVGGASKTFTVTVTGGEPGNMLTGEWFYSPNADGSGAVSLGLPMNMGQAELGATLSSTYTIDTPEAGNAGFYFASITDGLQTVTSDLAQLFVGTPLEVVTVPAGGFFHIGAAHVPLLSVTMEGGVGALSYQWFRDGEPLRANSSTYDLSPLAAMDAGIYTVRVRDIGIGDGRYFELSPTYEDSADGVYESPGVGLSVAGVPMLLPDGQPQHQKGPAGADYTFTANVVGGAGNLTYAWYKKNAAPPDTLVGEAPALTIKKAQPADQGLYYCVIKDRLAQPAMPDPGTVTSVTARLTLTAVEAPASPLRIVRQPVGLVVELNQPFELSVIAFGGSTTEYQYFWTKDGAPITDATESIFRNDGATMDDVGTYQVTVQAGATETATSNPVEVSIGPGVPLAGGLGLAALASLSALTGAVAMRRRRK